MTWLVLTSSVPADAIASHPYHTVRLAWIELGRRAHKDLAPFVREQCRIGLVGFEPGHAIGDTIRMLFLTHS